MSKLTEETKKKAEKLKIYNFDRINKFIFNLRPSNDSFTVKELKEFLLQFDDKEEVIFTFDTSIEYDYETYSVDCSGGSAQLDYANLLVQREETLSEEEVLKLIAEVEKKKARNLVASKKRKETEAKNKEKKIKRLEEQLEKLKKEIK